MDVVVTGHKFASNDPLKGHPTASKTFDAGRPINGISHTRDLDVWRDGKNAQGWRGPCRAICNIIAE